LAASGVPGLVPRAGTPVAPGSSPAPPGLERGASFGALRGLRRAGKIDRNGYRTKEQRMNETGSTFPTASSGTSTTGGSSTSANGASTTGASSNADMLNRVASTAHSAVDRVVGAAGPALEKLRGSASSAGEAMKAKADQFGAMEEQWIASARNYVRENPLAAVAIAAAVGLIIGKVTGGRDDDRHYR
jgi:ElaB/YqjD/DUF883 family membrane-anchored ribosome-binding protein